jgi:phosphoribosylformylglycinamidine synthase
MYTGKVFVTLKKAVLDPQGDTVKRSLHTMGYSEVADVRVGKYIEVKVEGQTKEEAQARLEEMTQKLLANPVIEEYRIELAD